MNEEATIAQLTATIAQFEQQTNEWVEQFATDPSQIAATSELHAAQQELNQAGYQLEKIQTQLQSLLTRWQAAQRNIEFLTQVAGLPENQVTETATHDLLGDAQRIDQQVADFAIAISQGQVSVEDARPVLSTLNEQLVALAQRPESNDPEFQRILNQANLDLIFAFSGGNGPHSTRLTQKLKDN